ncbi:protein transport protein sec23 [Anaeramoeba flamelloides]|uniref:Protein transport protein SEC23 n=1 Tax=Anaeramoeba flamelloides TaxID=1746091 RepID=A0AAV7YL37_9EUKA|nr:protein transport protein sec23 [Anaeramoeba flamelloides]
MSFYTLEEQLGTRFSWNIFPNTSELENSLVVPISCLYTPLHKVKDLQPVPYNPLQCVNCRNIINPFSEVDFKIKTWSCPFCSQRNKFPVQYHSISPQNLPAELLQDKALIEYILPNQNLNKEKNTIHQFPTFLFVVDLCTTEKELKALKESILEVVGNLNPNCLIGLITVGKDINVYDLAFVECPKSYLFSGSKQITTDEIEDSLRIRNSYIQDKNSNFIGINKFFQPAGECEFLISEIFNDLFVEPLNKFSKHRPKRGVGNSITISLTLMKKIFENKHKAGRIMLFLSGPSTIGDGKIVNLNRNNPIRSHSQIINGKATFSKNSLTFYENLAQQAVSIGVVVDLFACSFDQCGCYELNPLISKTGGELLLSDEFDHEIFKNTFSKVFELQSDDNNNENENDNHFLMKNGFISTIEIGVTRELCVLGAIGNCCSISPTSSSFHPKNVIGQGKTNVWQANGINDQTTLSFYFSVLSTQKNPIPKTRIGLIQFKTRWKDSLGNIHLRVLTSPHYFSDFSQQETLNLSFDQELSAVIMSRMAVERTKKKTYSSVIKWLDKSTIKFCRKVSNFTLDKAESFKISKEFSLFPQFMFYLRRSKFVKIFGHSPDETTFYNHFLYRENTTNSILMFQPSIISYSLNSTPKPVLLEMDSIKKDNILLLDEYFVVLILIGKQIAEWIKSGYHEMEEYSYLKEIIEAPQIEADRLIKNRFLYPRYIKCDQNSSQSRFLISKTNPNTPSSQNGYQNQDLHSLTDDINFNQFIKQLIQIVVEED